MRRLSIHEIQRSVRSSALLLVVACNHSRAQQAPALDPKADELLRRMSATLASCNTLAVQATIRHDQVADGGEKLTRTGRLDLKVRRPDGMLAQIKGPRESFTFAYDGQQVLLIDALRPRFARLAVPNTLDATLIALEKLKIETPLASFLFSNPYGALVARLKTGRIGPTEEIGSIKCVELVFTQEDVDWNVWVSQDMQGLPYKIEIIYKQRPQTPKFVATLERWDFQPLFEPNLFAVQIPPAAQQCNPQLIFNPPATEPGSTPASNSAAGVFGSATQP